MEDTAQVSEKSQDISDRVMDWVSKHWSGNHSCPVCKHNSWIAGEMVGEIRRHTPELVFPGDVYPVFPITCATCGYTLLFNALVSGMLDKRAAVGGEERDTQNDQDRQEVQQTS